MVSFFIVEILFAQKINPDINMYNRIWFADSVKSNNKSDLYIAQLVNRINSNQTFKSGIDFYNLAICYSSKNLVDSTCFYLFKCIAQSPNFNNLILTDTDFDFLHDMPCWSKLINQVDSIYLTLNIGIQNKELSVELYHIFLKDQHSRGLGLKKIDKNLINANSDSVSLTRVEEIIQKFGWPTFSMVGKTAAQGAFIVIQHLNFNVQQKYLKQISDAAKNNEASKESVALLIDRISVHMKGMQIFGTQVYRIRDPNTGKLGKYKYFPIRNEEKVDSLRIEAGLIPLKQYYALFGIDYNPVEK